MILHEKITVYSARASTRSILKNLRAIAKDLPQAHELGLRLFKRNLKAAYQQSLLGFGWALLPPVLTAALWIFLRSNGVMKTDITGISYPVFVLTGTMLWQIFNESILSPINSVSQNKAMLTKINIPREGLLISGLYDLTFHTFIKLVVLALVLLVFRQPVHLSGLCMVPVGVLAIILTGFSLGLVLAPIGMLYQDIGRTILAGLPFLMYLTPVVYNTPKTGIISQLMPYNPLASLITTTRNWLTVQPVPDPLSFWMYASFFALLFLLGLVLFRLSMPMIIERMGS